MIRRWFKRFLIWVALLSLALLLMGFVWQHAAAPGELASLDQRGQMVDAGNGHRLYLHCEGQGSPVVVLDNGLGTPLAEWNAVIAGLQGVTRICTYDRAGYGLSDAGPLPRTSKQIATELHTALQNAAVPAPYVLAGHSFGGYDIRVFTHLYPEQVAGLVFVDSSHEDQDQYLPKSFSAGKEQQSRLLHFGTYASQFGIHRMLFAMDQSTPPEWTRKIPGYADASKVYPRQPRFIEAIYSELTSFPESALQVKAAGNLGDRPVIVVTQGREPGPKEVPPGVSASDMKSFNQVWRTQLQPALARLSSRGEQRFAMKSGHMIPLEEPEAASYAIRDVVEKVRAK